MKKEITNIAMKAYRRRSAHIPDSYNNGKMIGDTRICGTFGDCVYHFLAKNLEIVVDVPQISVLRFTNGSEDTVSVLNKDKKELSVYGDSTNDWIFYGHALLEAEKKAPHLLSMTMNGDMIDLNNSSNLDNFLKLTDEMMNIVKDKSSYPDKVVCDEMSNLDMSEFEKHKAKRVAPTEPSKIEEKVAIDSYELNMGRELTEDEKMLIPEFDFGVINIPEYVHDAVNYCKRRMERGKYANLLFFGGAAGGKSTSTEIMAALMKIPHYSKAFSKGSDEVTILAGSDVTDGTVTYNDSPLVRCAKNGGVVELQEFYNAKGEVLTSLNNFLEKGLLELTNGKVVKRHPLCFVVATSNIIYEGGQAIDFSVDSRFRFKELVDDIGDEELIHRVMVESGNKDKKMVSKMVKAYKDVKIVLEREEHDEGIADVRALESWAELVDSGMDPKKAVWKSFLPTISKDKAKMQEIYDSYIRHVFS